ncbi:D-alanyl-D-alanine carboxypeptidase [Streptomyces griseocarneus]|nr:D-alanyl-D-alanine carboxypeptidase [Streptomyces griseocarneus]
MAGESPGKSEQRKSSGETTGSERDPRLEVFREQERPEKPRPESGADAADKDGKDSKNGKADSKGEKAAADRPTAVFGAVKPKAAAAAGKDGDAAESGPAAEETATATATAVKAKDEDAETAETSGASEDAAKPANGAAKPAADRATAVFRAVKPKADGDDEAAVNGDSAGDDEAAAESKPAANGSGAAEKPAADQPTAVFGAVKVKGEAAAKPANGAEKAHADGKDTDGAEKDGAAKPSWARADKDEDKADDKPADGAEAEKDGDKKPAVADQPTAVFGAVKPKAETEGGDAAGKPAADQPTTVLGAVKADKAAKDGGEGDGKGSSDDQPTALMKAPKAPEKDSAKDSGKAKAPAESDSERTSQFVPLKSLDGEPAKPKGKPTVPVTVTPPTGTPKAAPKAGAKDGKDADKAAADKAAEKADKADKATDAKAADAKTADAEPEAKAERPEVPPQPATPLDLLAQLTNTPPPAPTPVRSTLRRVKIYTPIVVLLAVVFAVVQAFRPLPAPKLAVASAKATYTFDGNKFAMPWPDQGQAAVKVVGVGSLGTYGDEKPTPTASVAKVMTAYVILKNHPLKTGEKGPNIKVDAQAERDSHAQDESKVTLKEGETVSEYDLLQMLLIPSGNNAARLLGRWDAQSQEAFVAKMNEAAKSLGMSNTTYTDPSGLDATTKSTAVDQLKLAEEVMKDDVFREIVRKPNTDVAGGQHLNNNNDELLIKPGGLGIKTGSSTPAGGTLMWAAYRTVDGKQRMILGATMAQHYTGGPDVNAEMSLKLVKKVSYKMVEDIQNALTSAKIVSKGDVVGYVDDGLGGRTPVVATADLQGVGVPGMTARLALDAGGKGVPHTAKAGTQVGELVVGSGPEAMKVPVALQKDLAEPGFGAKLTRLG